MELPAVTFGPGWPPLAVAGQMALASQYNDVLDAMQTWRGNVSAGGFGLTNLSSISTPSSAVLTLNAPLQVLAAPASPNSISLTFPGGVPTITGAGGPLQLSDAGGVVCQNALTVTGVATLNSGLTVTGVATFNSNLTVAAAGAATFNGPVTVTNTSTTGTQLTITNTSTGGLSFALVAPGSSATYQGYLLIKDAASANVFAAIGTNTLGTRCAIKLPSYGIYAWASDTAAATGPDTGIERVAGQILSITQGQGTGVGTGQLRLGTLDVYDSGTGNRFALYNPSGTATFVATAGLQLFGLAVQGSPASLAFTLTNSGGTGGPRTLQITVPNSGAVATISTSAAITNISVVCGVAVTGSISSTATISGAARLTSGGDITISASGSGAAGSYLQMSNNGQWTPDTNPWMYSSTGWIIAQSNIGFKQGAGWAVYGPGVGGTSYVSTGWSGANPLLTSSTGLLVISGSLTVTNILNVNANVGINSGGLLYVYNSASTQSMTMGFSTVNPTLTSTTNILQLNPVVAFAAVDACISRSSTGVLAHSDSSGVPCSITAGNVTVYNSTKAQYAYFNGGTTPPTISSNAAQINVLCPLYSTTTMSATAFNVHASGSSVADIQRSFLRSEPVYGDVPNPYGEMESRIVKNVIPPDHWGLVLGEDGLHIICKRSETSVMDHVIQWGRFKELGDIPTPLKPKLSDKAN